MKKQIIGLLIIIGLMVSSVALADSTSSTSTKKSPGVNKEVRLENRGEKVALILDRASTTERRLENRQNNIERIRAKIASTTLASTTGTSTEKRLGKLDDRLEKQVEQMSKVKDRLQNKEVKIIDVLGKIASKIQARIDILIGKGLDLTSAKAKLTEASIKIEAMTDEAANLTELLGKVPTTDTDSTALFQEIKTAQDKIRTLAKETHALLVDTVKEITKVLPRNGQATSTATTTE
jgi:HAMP domain-containing protein